MKLIFVYNAEAGLLAGIMDSVHKIVSPATYECELCAITHGVLRMDPKWKAWLAKQDFDTVFHHRPDFRRAFPALASLALPAILRERAGAIDALLGREALQQIDSTDGLIAAIEARLRD